MGEGRTASLSAKETWRRLLRRRLRRAAAASEASTADGEESEGRRGRARTEWQEEAEWLAKSSSAYEEKKNKGQTFFCADNFANGANCCRGKKKMVLRV